jgi:hypothetical protein
MSGDFGWSESTLSAGGSVRHCTQFRVGGVSVGVAADSHDDIRLVSSLQLFRVKAGVPDIQIQIERAERLSETMGRPLFDSGSVWRLYEDDPGYRFDFSTPAMGESPYKRLTVDREFRRANLLISDECIARGTLSAAPLDYPLDELLIMHRLTREKAIELHSCGIVRPDGTANLFVGHSGAGKSTTTRLWTEREDVEVLSDDRIIVRRDAVDDPGRMRMYGTPWHGEAMYASPGSAPLKRIFILRHGHGNVLTRLSPSQAVAELFARSFVPFHRHEFVDSALVFLQEVVAAVPVYLYSFEPDGRAVDAILNFRD